MRFIRTAVALSCLMLTTTAWAELRVYDVDSQFRQEIFEALSNVLDSPPEKDNAARVQLLPTGQLLVEARPQVHEQIAHVLEAIASRPPSPTPSATLHYWVLLGAPEGRDTGDASEVVMPPALAPLMSELRRIHGDLRFRLVGSSRLTSQSGQSGELGAVPGVSIDQELYVQGQTLNGEIEISFISRAGGGAVRSLDVNAALERGEFLVLGESAIADEELNGTLFFVVQWPEED